MLSEPVFGPHPGPVSLPSALWAGYLGNSWTETLPPVHSPAGHTNTQGDISWQFYLSSIGK